MSSFIRYFSSLWHKTTAQSFAALHHLLLKLITKDNSSTLGKSQWDLRSDTEICHGMVELLLDPVQVVWDSHINTRLIAEATMLTPRDYSVEFLDTWKKIRLLLITNNWSCKLTYHQIRILRVLQNLPDRRQFLRPVFLHRTFHRWSHCRTHAAACMSHHPEWGLFLRVALWLGLLRHHLQLN